MRADAPETNRSAVVESSFRVVGCEFKRVRFREFMCGHRLDSRLYRLLMLSALLLVFSNKLVHGQFELLARRIPRDANALVLFNVEKILQSEIAVKEGWKDKHEAAFDDGLVFLPPAARHFILGSQIDLDFVEPIWEIAVLDFATVPSLKDFATRHGGTSDQLAGFPTVSLPHDAYVVKFDARTVGAMAPGNRQSVSRWLQQVKGRRSLAVSPYLEKAIGYADRVGTEIVMALDLTDAYQPEVVRRKLDAMECLKDKDLNLDELATQLAGIQGVTLGVVTGKRAFGELKVEFATVPAELSEIGHELLLEILANNGAMIDDFDHWNTAVDKHRLSIKGPLTPEGMRRIFSLVDSPTESVEKMDDSSATAGTDDPKVIGYSSQIYFHSITKLLEGLRRDKSRIKTIASISVWLDRYARKIDRLPILHVDSELLDFGAFVSGQLRDASLAVKGIGIQSGSEQAQVYQTGGYRYGRFGYYGGVDNVGGERRAIRYEERAKGATSAIDIMTNLENETAAIRRKMTDRYRIEF